MDDKSDIGPHQWILALAVALVAVAAVSIWKYSNLEGGLGILAIANQKVADDVASLKQELAAQHEALDSLKALVAETKGPHAPAPAAETAPSAEPHATPAATKVKPRR